MQSVHCRVFDLLRSCQHPEHWENTRHGPNMEATTTPPSRKESMDSTMPCLYGTCCSPNRNQYYCFFSARSTTKLDAMKRLIFMNPTFSPFNFIRKGGSGPLFLSMWVFLGREEPLHYCGSLKSGFHCQINAHGWFIHCGLPLIGGCRDTDKIGISRFLH
jgi:hypothetical protein